MKVAVVLLALLPSLACGQSRYSSAPYQGPGENVTYGYAQVLRATPAYEIVRTRSPEQRCDGQAVRDGGNPTGGTVVGAIVGGALGNQAGKGDGRKAATVAGAVLGGVIAATSTRTTARPAASAAAPSRSSARSAGSRATTSSTCSRARNTCRGWTTTRATACACGSR
jgi:hypothetical protein